MEAAGKSEGYFRGLVPERSSLLRELEKEAKDESIPIVGPVVGELLYIVARFSGARQVLELGTAIGYSGLYLAEACRETGGRLVTLEIDEDMAARAHGNFVRAGLDDCVEIMIGDALKSLAGISGSFDLVFLDIEKRDYRSALDFCEKLLKPGGLLVADNTSLDGAEDFNSAVTASPAWRAVQLFAFLPLHSPERDGLCLALRTSPPREE